MSQQELEREVLAELEAGNWPLCHVCLRTDRIDYLGILTGSPTFMCTRCSMVFAMDLTDAEDRNTERPSPLWRTRP